MKVPWLAVALMLIPGIRIYGQDEDTFEFQLGNYSTDYDYHDEMLGLGKRGNKSLNDTSRPSFNGLMNLSFIETNTTYPDKTVIIDEIDKILEKTDSPTVQDGYEFDEDENFDLEHLRKYARQGLGHSGFNFTNLEQMEIVRLHNTYRGNMTEPVPFMSNINYLEWDKVLAADAELQTSQCKLISNINSNISTKIGGGLTNATSNYSSNSYDGSTRHVAWPIWMWYRTYKEYNFKDQSCQPNKRCSSYEVMTYYFVTNVGCGRTMCWPREERSRIVCHYAPRIDRRVKMFKYGNPCDNCERGSGARCFKNLCVTDKICKDHHLRCVCNLKCLNCGKLNKASCNCDCKSGWDYPNCGVECRNEIVQACTPAMKNTCSANPVASQRNCRSLCGTCKKQPSFANKTRDGNLCCRGKRCEIGQHVEEKTCECVSTCPSEKCMFKSSSAEPNSVGAAANGTKTGTIVATTPGTKKKKKNGVPASFLPSVHLLVLNCIFSFVLVFFK